MPPTIISRKASNWVDRGEPPNPKLRRVLGHFFERVDEADAPWMEEHALIAKAALVRDFAERVLRGDVPANNPTPDKFGHWVASRLLSPEELAQFEREAREDD